MFDARGRSSKRPPREGWRGTLDSFGGPVVVGTLVVTVVVIVVMAIRAMPSAPSEAALRGEAVRVGPAAHVAAASALEIPEGQPPAGGPHLIAPHPTGIFEQPVPDGNVIHSLEHGIVWITYRPDLISTKDLETLRAVARAYAGDVILSPRPANSAAVSAVSWERRANMASPVTEKALRDFVTTNRNRSPEPGVR